MALVRAPERLPADFASTVPELRLSVASAHGAGPGIFPADEAMARWRQVHPPPRIDTTPMNQYAVL